MLEVASLRLHPSLPPSIYICKLPISVCIPPSLPLCVDIYIYCPLKSGSISYRLSSSFFQLMYLLRIWNAENSTSHDLFYLSLIYLSNLLPSLSLYFSLNVIISVSSILVDLVLLLLLVSK